MKAKCGCLKFSSQVNKITTPELKSYHSIEHTTTVVWQKEKQRMTIFKKLSVNSGLFARMNNVIKQLLTIQSVLTWSAHINNKNKKKSYMYKVNENLQVTDFFKNMVNFNGAKIQ